ncbi:MAG: hypothetical protein AAFV53_31265 [Myxococcota bacterium]
MEDPLRVEVRATGEVLQRAFSTLVAGFPAGGQTISGMARYLGVTKSTTQRLVEGLRAADPVAAVRAFPGSKGLRRIVDAARGQSMPEPHCAAAMQAVDGLDRLLLKGGGSKARLLNQLDDARRFQGRRQATEADRRALAQAAGAVLANHSEARLSIRVVRADPSDPQQWTLRHMATGHIGMRRAAGARPQIGSHQITIANTAVLNAPPRLLEDFTTPNTQLETLRDDRMALGELQYRLRPPVAPGEPFDYIADIGGPLRVEHPARSENRQLVAGVFVDSPTNTLIMDLFVEPSLLPGAVPGVDVLPGHEILRRPLGRDEHEQWPHQVTPLALGRALQHPTSKQWAPLLNLERQLFKGWALDPNQFIGYRLEARYPIFSALYAFSLALP